MAGLIRINDASDPPDSLFSGGRLFEIHPPQRRFRWESRQIQELWDDIVNARDTSRDSYFLGTLLLVPLSDGRVSVIDGQQRITTLSLLLAILRDYCARFENLRFRANKLHELISRVDHDGNPVGSLVVTLQNPDAKVYKELVEQVGSTNDIGAGPGLLRKALVALKQKVSNHVGTPDPDEDTLRDLCQYIQTSVKLLPIEVPNEIEGYLVFDTTNARGLRLSQSESLKACVATVARQNSNLSNELLEQWNEVAQKLDRPTLSMDVMDNYLHVIWCSKKGYTTKRRLGDVVRKELNNSEKLEAFMYDLQAYCDSYLDVVVPSQDDPSLRRDLEDLNHLNVQCHSFLTMVHKHANHHFREAVDLVLSLQIRNITIGTMRPNTFEKHWPRWAIDVRQGNIDKAFQKIRGNMVDDETFRQAMESKTIMSTATAAHLLRRLDPVNAPGGGVHIVGVDVEHILPRSVIRKLANHQKLTPNVKHWIEDLGHRIPESTSEMDKLGEVLSPMLNSLGNQALLNSTANKVAKDRRFSKKKAFYGTQKLDFTSSLVNRDEWGPIQIMERQQEMAHRAPEIWRKERA